MAHPTSIEAMIDRRFLDYALEKLGRVDDKCVTASASRNEAGSIAHEAALGSLQ